MYYDWVMEPVSNTLGISMNMINIAFGVIVGLIAAVFVFFYGRIETD
jgi:ABC-type Fe3+-siderophore transport system permease subunit